MNLRWTTPARRDLVAILDYIDDHDPAAASSVLERVESAAIRLRSFPLLGREGVVADTRELAIPTLPYLLVYRVRRDAIEILRVLHGARQWPPT